MQRYHKLDTPTQVFFYENEFYCLSNFSAFRVLWKDIDFDTAEAAYHWEKFKGEQNRNIRSAIRRANSAHEAFKISQFQSKFRRTDWEEVRVETMKHILKAKLNQHEYVKRKLLETGNRELIEDSWRDGFWGWGQNHSGMNILGKLWMELRAELRGETYHAGL